MRSLTNSRACPLGTQRSWLSTMARTRWWSRVRHGTCSRTALAGHKTNYMKYHDPLAGANATFSVGYWLHTFTYLPYCDCALQIELTSQGNSSAQRLTEFRGPGGLYTGPLPSNPTGRYKRNGDGSCSWTTADSGPNQCQPSSSGGRWKINNGCHWFPNNSGPNQCAPSTGRWKINNGCVWYPNDSGPNQCTPQARVDTPGHSRFALLGGLRSWMSASRTPLASRSVTSPFIPSGQEPNSLPRAESYETLAMPDLKANQDDRDGNPVVPHPGSLDVNDILENIDTVIRETGLAEFMEMDELRGVTKLQSGACLCRRGVSAIWAEQLDGIRQCIAQGRTPGLAAAPSRMQRRVARISDSGYFTYIE